MGERGLSFDVAAVYAQLSLLQELLGEKNQALLSRQKALEIAAPRMPEASGDEIWRALLNEWQVERTFYLTAEDRYLGEVLGADEALQTKMLGQHVREAESSRVMPKEQIPPDKTAILAALRSLEIFLFAFVKVHHFFEMARLTAEAYHAAGLDS